MPLAIIDNGDRHEYKIKGSVIYYTRLPWGGARDMREDARNPTTLRVDPAGVEEAVLRKHVVGWTNVLDRGGKPVPFSLDMLLMLPQIHVDTLLTMIQMDVVTEQEEHADLPAPSAT